MLTDGEIATIESLLPKAKAQVDSLHEKTGFLSWLLVDTDRQAYIAAQSVYDAAVAQYQTSKASPDDQHEEALQIVESLNHVIDPNWAPAQVETVGSAVGGLFTQARSWVGDKLTAAGDAIGLGSVATWIKVAIVVVGLVAVAYLAGILKPLLPRRRST